MDSLTLPLLCAAGCAGGFVDAIAGGGGLISVPALLWAGLPPSLALGTNKFQSTVGATLTVARYAAAGMLGTPGLRLAVACAFAAAVGGAWAVTRLDPALLKKLVPWMLAAIAIYTWLRPGFGRTGQKSRLSPPLFASVCGVILGFYDGFFGPGAGSFWTMACVGLLGLELRAATGYTKAANLASNAGSLIFFLAAGHVDFNAGLVMAAGQLLGARLGSGLVISRGAKLIRPVFLTVVLALTAKLLWEGIHHQAVPEPQPPGPTEPQMPPAPPKDRRS